LPSCQASSSLLNTHRRDGVSDHASPGASPIIALHAGPVLDPQKRPLIRVTERPPQLETPFTVFDDASDSTQLRPPRRAETELPWQDDNGSRHRLRSSRCHPCYA
jgi:hypothetical protein